MSITKHDDFWWPVVVRLRDFNVNSPGYCYPHLWGRLSFLWIFLFFLFLQNKYKKVVCFCYPTRARFAAGGPSEGGGGGGAP